jgi:hypothetical protein
MSFFDREIMIMKNALYTENGMKEKRRRTQKSRQKRREWNERRENRRIERTRRKVFFSLFTSKEKKILQMNINSK